MTGIKLTLKLKSREPKYFKIPLQNNRLNIIRAFSSVYNATRFFLFQMTPNLHSTT
jgi:hypothetical protein